MWNEQSSSLNSGTADIDLGLTAISAGIMLRSKSLPFKDLADWVMTNIHD
jgi:hypothetical protein